MKLCPNVSYFSNHPTQNQTCLHNKQTYNHTYSKHAHKDPHKHINTRSTSTHKQNLAISKFYAHIK